MINRKFINFKTYNGFLAKKNEIPEDSIVFIQENNCIWARGKEYICDGPSTASVERDTLTFKTGLGDNEKLIFKLLLDNGTITIEDSEGIKSSATYVLKDIYDGTITNIYDAISNILEISGGYTLTGELADVAFSGSYNDLKNLPNPITVDSNLSSESENPVLNKVIYSKLLDKADSSALSGYVTTNKHESDLEKKQEKLFADYGIDIFRDIDQKLKIKTTLDNSIYVIVESIESVVDPDPNKIYILESLNQDGTYRYLQYRYRNGRWVSFDMVLPTIDLHEYQTKEDAEILHGLIWNTINAIDLTPYAKIEDDINPIWSNFNKYATKKYVDDNFQPADDYATKDWIRTYFVQKVQVYYPKQGEWGTSEPSEGGSGSLVVPVVLLTIEVDKDLSLYSPHPVENATVTHAIYDLQDNKADKSTLSSYATKQDLQSIDLSGYVTNGDFVDALNDKQDVLIPAPNGGISIIDNVISTTLDTSVYVFVDELPSTNINEDKIYIIERLDGNDPIYTLYRWNSDINDWTAIGHIVPEVDLTSYLKQSDAESVYLKKADAINAYLPKRNDYALTSDVDSLREYVDETFQEADDYALRSDVTALRMYSDNAFLRKGGYALASDVTSALITLLSIIDTKYVLKKDVYNPNNANWSSSDPTQITINPSAGGGSQGEPGSEQPSYTGSNMVTLTVEEYEALVRNDMVNQNTYYFTYIPEEPETWSFGDKFPIILTDNWAFGGTFPITLT